MSLTYPAGYYDRTDQTKHYDQHLFVASRVLQAAELNEIQSEQHNRLRRISDVLFEDGTVVSGADVLTHTTDGVCTVVAQAGALYVAGAVRGIVPRTFTIATTGKVALGVYLTEAIVTAATDPGLYDPAVSTINQGQSGAARLQVSIAWGYAGEAGAPGSFYPVYAVEDGVVLVKTPPPQIDAVSLAIARYDRQSAGGMYVSSGLAVTCLADDTSGRQVYSLAAGVARVNGEEIILDQGRRIPYAGTADTRQILLEQHIASGGTERVDVAHPPIATIEQLAVEKQASLTKTRGTAAGGKDYLSPTYTSVTTIVSVVSGETTYTAGRDYLLTSDAIDWSPHGTEALEPAAGVTYTVVLRYIDIVTPTSPDATGFTVSGAAAGTNIQVSYHWNMPRYDLLCLAATGETVIVNGVSFASNPRPPQAPSGLLGLALIEQHWYPTGTRTVTNVAVKMVPMSDLNAVNTRIDTLFALIAEERLALNLTLADPTAKRGVFADAFYDDDLRDSGIAQTAAIFAGELTLGVAAVGHTQSLAAVGTLDRSITPTTVLEQTLQTGAMLINPYDSFAPMPGVGVLSPAVDFWSSFLTDWTSPVTRQFSEEIWTNPDRRDAMLAFGASVNYYGMGLAAWNTVHTVVAQDVVQQTMIEKVGTRYADAQYLRSIPVWFALSGFGAGEVLNTVTIDGITVTASAP
ncbi:DUF4815 domain-containing protein [uncultured Thiodictyon sp.]|uniref:DUF4815 domain-containing protein n=1 Tax=uncultured Thiodictyon sp. TaxID=1846217 RepID=UPI0025CBF4A6|nr:DUF4815 domain-containing protein [uncultured Thiodictyon sp.]